MTSIENLRMANKKVSDLYQYISEQCTNALYEGDDPNEVLNDRAFRIQRIKEMYSDGNPIYKAIIEFSENEIDMDTFVFFVGCCMNMYYILGFFEALGPFDIDSVVKAMPSDDNSDKHYLQNLSNWYLANMKEIYDGFAHDYDEDILTDPYFDYDGSDYLTVFTQTFTSDYLKDGYPGIYAKKDFIIQAGKITITENASDLLKQLQGYTFGGLILAIEKLENFDYDSANKDYIKASELLEKLKPITESHKSIFDRFHPSYTTTSIEEMYSEAITHIEASSSKSHFEQFEFEARIGKSLYCQRKIYINAKKHDIFILRRKFTEAVLDKNIALRERDNALKEKHSVINEFAHTYGNMQATTLQDIGKELLSEDDDLLHEWGRKIMVEYAIKQNLTKEVEMLKLQFEDQSSALIQKLKDSMSSDDKSISDLVSDSLQRCFMALLYGETRNDKSKRSLFFGTDDYSDRREALQESFEQEVLIGEEKALTWLNVNHVLNISVDVSGMWQALFFDDGGYAALLLTNWITELLTNVIKYADKTKPIALSFSQKDEMLVISIQNYKEPSAIRIHGTQQGISSITASIRRLNQAVDCDENIESKNEDADVYQLQLFLSSKVISS